MPPSTHGRPVESQPVDDFTLRGEIYRRGDHVYMDPEERTDPYFVGTILDIFQTPRPLIKPLNGAAHLSTHVSYAKDPGSDVSHTYIHVSWFLRLADATPIFERYSSFHAFLRETNSDQQRPLSRASSTSSVNSTQGTIKRADSSNSTASLLKSSSVGESGGAMDARLLFASMHSDVNPIGAIRGKCTIKHLNDIVGGFYNSAGSTDPATIRAHYLRIHRQCSTALHDYKAMENTFYYWQAYDRYTHNMYDVIPSIALYMSDWVHDAVLELIYSHESCLVETSATFCIRPEEAAKRYCAVCSMYCGCNEMLLYVQCGECNGFYHRGCLQPPLPFSGFQSTRRYATRGFAWYCPSCVGQLDQSEQDSKKSITLQEKTNTVTPPPPIIKEHPVRTINTQSAAPGSRSLANLISRLWPFRYYGIYAREGDEYVDEETSIFPFTRSRIGKAYQAVVPEFVPVKRQRPMDDDGQSEQTNSSKEAYEMEELEERRMITQSGTCVWRCQHIDEKALDAYITAWYERLHIPTNKEDRLKMDDNNEEGEGANTDKNIKYSAELIIEEFLTALHTNHYDPKEALLQTSNGEHQHHHHHPNEEEEQNVHSGTIPHRSTMREIHWSEKEWSALQKGIDRYENQLPLIKKYYLPLAKMKDIVRAYYYLKRSKEYRRQREEIKNSRGNDSLLHHMEDSEAEGEADDNAPLTFSQRLLVNRNRKNVICASCLTIQSTKWKIGNDITPFKTVPASIIRASQQNLALSSSFCDKPLLCYTCALFFKRYGSYPDIDYAQITSNVAKYEKEYGCAPPGVKKNTFGVTGGSSDYDDDDDDNNSTDDTYRHDDSGTRGPPKIKKMKYKEDKSEHHDPLHRGRQKLAHSLLKRSTSLSFDTPHIRKIPSHRVIVARDSSTAMQHSTWMTSGPFCAVCYDNGDTPDTPLTQCKGCHIYVHDHCYGVPWNRDPLTWLCSPCQNDVNPSITTNYVCVLCFSVGGAMKRTIENHWVHCTCAILLEGVQFSRKDSLEPVQCIGKTLKNSTRQCEYVYCQIHKQKQRSGLIQSRGGCIGCHVGGCTASVHATCLFMQVKDQVKVWYDNGGNELPEGQLPNEHLWHVELSDEKAIATCPRHADTNKTLVHRVKDESNNAAMSARYKVSLSPSEVASFVYRCKLVPVSQKEDLRIYSVELNEECLCHRVHTKIVGLSKGFKTKKSREGLTIFVDYSPIKKDDRLKLEDSLEKINELDMLEAKRLDAEEPSILAVSAESSATSSMEETPIDDDGMVS